MLQLKDIGWLNGYKAYIYEIRASLQMQTHTQIESEGKKQDIPYKWKDKARWLYLYETIQTLKQRLARNKEGLT